MSIPQNNVIEKPEIDKFKDLNLDKFKDIQKELDAPAQLHKQQKKNGNQTEELATIKKAGEKEILTPEEFKARARELKKCKNDILYFCRKYFKIVSLKDGLVTLNPYAKQAELLEFIKNNNRVICTASRQVGKTTIYTVYLLWYAMFHPDKRVMVCGNKLSIAIEIMDRIRLGYEYCPKDIKIGVKTYNKGCIEFENNSIIRCFATGSSGCRGFSANCVSGDTMVTILDDDDNVWYIPIEKVETVNANSSINCKQNMMEEFAFMYKNKKYYYVYRIVNDVNGKEYTGFHSTNNLDDGYMGSGNLIIKAIEKYGIEHFHKEIIQIFDNRKDAEQLEREIVNEDYVKRKDTYNISLGGNVCILFGEDNGFYGKHHSEDAKSRMSKSKKLYYSENESKLKGVNQDISDDVIIDGITYNSRNHALIELGIGMDKLNKLLLKEGNGFVDEDRQMRHIEFMLELEAQKEINHQIHLERVKVANKDPERREKISKSLKGRKNTWNDKINHNPEKIRKTAQKHRGMKRSEEAKKNMSDGLKEYYASHQVSNKGKVWIHNPTTNEKKYVEPTITIPEGWFPGMGKRVK